MTLLHRMLKQEQNAHRVSTEEISKAEMGGGILGGGILEERPALPAILEFQEARGVH